MNLSRRDFLSLLSISSLSFSHARGKLAPNLSLKGISPDFTDQVILAEGLNYHILIEELQNLGGGLTFGACNDYLQWADYQKNEALLWVNHEYVIPFLHSSVERNRQHIGEERKMVGGSLIHLRKEQNQWKLQKGSKLNKRFDADTVIPFAGSEVIAGSTSAVGTLANCAGGKTPWGTILTCEENFDLFYSTPQKKSLLGWEKFYPHPPEHYGWVVEIEPFSGRAKKLISLGRMAHECATVHPFSKQKTVVYTGDDAADEHLYKFISDSSQSLETGTLYVAQFQSKKWIPLTLNHPQLKKRFKNQTEILIHAREAAKLVGATPLDRPEDIEIDPQTGHVFISLTNNKWNKNYHGKILKLMEPHPESLSFEFQDYVVGGEKGGFSCPDNLAFDPAGNLWFTSDIAGYEQFKDHYQNFGNNGLFVVPRSGNLAGMPVQIASAPFQAEFTGPLFTPDGETLFLSVQHPGEFSSEQQFTSHWPHGGKHLPKSAVITIQGPLLKNIMGVLHAT